MRLGGGEYLPGVEVNAGAFARSLRRESCARNVLSCDIWHLHHSARLGGRPGRIERGCRMGCEQIEEFVIEILKPGLLLK